MSGLTTPRQREQQKAWYLANREYARAKDRLWYAEHRESIKARTRARSKVQREYIAELKNHPCSDCGGMFPSEAMDFDHVRGEKLMVIGRSHSKNLGRVLEEIAKCDLVCSNCHRIRTFSRLRQDAAQVRQIEDYARARETESGNAAAVGGF